MIDAYDAMRSERVYRKAIPHTEAAAEIISNAGKQFDPQVVEALAFYDAHRDELEAAIAAEQQLEAAGA